MVLGAYWACTLFLPAQKNGSGVPEVSNLLTFMVYHINSWFSRRCPLHLSYIQKPGTIRVKRPFLTVVENILPKRSWNEDEKLQATLVLENFGWVEIQSQIKYLCLLIVFDWHPLIQSGIKWQIALCQSCNEDLRRFWRKTL